MRKVKIGPACRRPIVAWKNNQCTAENALTQHEPRRLVIVDSLSRRRTVVWDTVPERDVQSEIHVFIEQRRGITPSPPLPKNPSKRIRTLTFNHSLPKEPMDYGEFIEDWRHRGVIGEGGDSKVHQFQQWKHKDVYLAVKVPQSLSVHRDLRQEIINMCRIGDHDVLHTRYVHNDLKLHNILAFMPREHLEPMILPEEPIFKLSDFARLTPSPTPIGRRARGFDGMYEYAPPAKERVTPPILPSANIWGLGTTPQYMALGMTPIQTRKAFIWSREGTAQPHPNLHDNDAWESDYWLERVPTVFRPINLPHDIPHCQPFSARLGFWYAQPCKPVGTRNKGRPTASRLVREVVPNIENQIECLKIKRNKEMQRIKDVQHKEAVATGKAELE
ncbi:uncharacterized protein M421DRAFT_91697 [Didymella exigua CBS 183.55]|uniref:Protein kinase domain-containing protein n=1 Tax=Didymella exigua CBS 183.55 TaxID=1150837 RepID=A0A6A5RPV1_9PLEO|nr:uncharacterized protein M421DRAFT_91697 [Didymella exigua CBS 183.55]KAF1929188.1 hypothetical protein M421DRAFT_91697 [Didymella exigua CBS 183.55]